MTNPFLEKNREEESFEEKCNKNFIESLNKISQSFPQLNILNSPADTTTQMIFISTRNPQTDPANQHKDTLKLIGEIDLKKIQNNKDLPKSKKEIFLELKKLVETGMIQYQLAKARKSMQDNIV